MRPKAYIERFLVESGIIVFCSPPYEPDDPELSRARQAADQMAVAYNQCVPRDSWQLARTVFRE